jgi:cysteine-rich repeat protein
VRGPSPTRRPRSSSRGLIYTATQAETVYFFVESFYGLPNESIVDITTQTFDIRFDLVSCGAAPSRPPRRPATTAIRRTATAASSTCTVETGYLLHRRALGLHRVPELREPDRRHRRLHLHRREHLRVPQQPHLRRYGCVGGSVTARPDITFEVQLAAGDSLRVTEHNNSLDALIHLQTGTCGATNACAASIDFSEDTTGLFYTSPTAQTVYVFLEPYSTSSSSTAFDIRFNYIRCGDGVRESTEACDDGNNTPGDGCSATCTVETGFICDQASPSVCGPVPAADCSAPIMAGDGFNYVGNNIANFGHADFFSGAGCTNGTASLQRPEIVFSVPLSAGDQLTVTEHGPSPATSSSSRGPAASRAA